MLSLDSSTTSRWRRCRSVSSSSFLTSLPAALVAKGFPNRGHKFELLPSAACLLFPELHSLSKCNSLSSILCHLLYRPLTAVTPSALTMLESFMDGGHLLGNCLAIAAGLDINICLFHDEITIFSKVLGRYFCFYLTESYVLRVCAV